MDFKLIDGALRWPLTVQVEARALVVKRRWRTKRISFENIRAVHYSTTDEPPSYNIEIDLLDGGRARYASFGFPMPVDPAPFFQVTAAFLKAYAVFRPGAEVSLGVSPKGQLLTIAFLVPMSAIAWAVASLWDDRRLDGIDYFMIPIVIAVLVYVVLKQRLVVLRPLEKIPAAQLAAQFAQAGSQLVR